MNKSRLINSLRMIFKFLIVISLCYVCFYIGTSYGKSQQAPPIVELPNTEVGTIPIDDISKMYINSDGRYEIVIGDMQWVNHDQSNVLYYNIMQEVNQNNQNNK